MSEKAMGITFFSIVTEALVTYVTCAVNNDFSWKMLLSILIGTCIAVLYNLDIPSYFNLKSNIPFLGNFVTGIIISRGSNYVYDWLNMIK